MLRPVPGPPELKSKGFFPVSEDKEIYEHHQVNILLFGFSYLIDFSCSENKTSDGKNKTHE